MSGADGIVKIPELRKRILFTLMMLAVYRVGVHIPTPGIDGAALQQVFSQMQGTIFGWFNLFSGGALERFSIFALGVMPYISSSIIFQLLTVVIPYLHDLQKEGDQGRKKITQYTRYGTVFLCFIQGYSIAAGLEAYNNPPVVFDAGIRIQDFDDHHAYGRDCFLDVGGRTNVRTWNRQRDIHVDFCGYRCGHPIGDRKYV